MYFPDIVGVATKFGLLCNTDFDQKVIALIIGRAHWSAHCCFVCFWCYLGIIKKCVVLCFRSVEEVHEDGTPTTKTFEHVPVSFRYINYLF